jgi:hypothetical protein
MTYYQKLAAALLIAVAYLAVAILVLREDSARRVNFTLCPLCGQ